MSERPISSRYLDKLAQELFNSSEEQSSFVDAICAAPTYPEAILWLKDRPEVQPFELAPRTEWQPEFVDRVVRGQRPGAHQLHQEGAYYCLDFSSVFAAQVLSAVTIESPLVLDLCASPGGKAIFSHRLLNPSLLVCNETIGKRLGALTSNIKRCQIMPVAVVSRDPRVVAEVFAAGADLVIVDAPCSGQSLITKGKDSMGAFHPTTVNLNKNRQRRIIAEASKTVAPGGFLAYMTCTFSVEENEEIIAWFLKKFPHFTALPVEALLEFQSPFSDTPAYRLWPQSGLGAGSFAVLLQNTEEGVRQDYDLATLPISWTNPQGLFENSNRDQRKQRNR